MSRLLSELIKKELRKEVDERSILVKIKDQLLADWNALSKPDRHTFLTIVLFHILLLIIIATITYYAFKLDFIPLEYLSIQKIEDVGITMQIIGGFISSLLIFAVGFTAGRDRSNNGTKSILRITKIYPIFILFCIYIFTHLLLILAIPKYEIVKSAKVALIIENLILIILFTRAFHKSMSFRMNEKFYSDSIVELGEFTLKNLRKNLTKHLIRLLGRSLLYNEVNSQKLYHVKYKPLLIEGNKRTYSYSSIRTGYITDIDLDKFEKFYDRLDYLLSNELNTTLKKGVSNKFITKLPTFIQHIASFTEIASTSPSSKAILHVRFNYDDFLENNQPIFTLEVDKQVDEKIISEILQDKELNQIINSMIISDESNIRPDRYFNYNIGGIKDGYLKAVKDNSLSEIETYNRLYLKIIDEFKKFLIDYNIQVSINEAEAEVNSLEMEIVWKDIRQLFKDIYELLEVGINKSNRQTTEKVLDLNSALLFKIVNEPNFLLFKYLIRNFRLIYEQLNDFDTKYRTDQLEHHIFMNLYQAIEFVLLPNLKKTNDKTAFEFYALEILKGYQGLLKLSFDKRQLEDFRLFASKINEIFSHEPRFNNSVDLDSHDLEKNLGTLDFEQFQYLFANKNKSILYFGFTSWILSQLNEANVDELAEYINILEPYITSDLYKLSNIYIECIEDRNEKNWDWAWWNVPASYKPSVFSRIGLEKEFSLLFIIKSLKILDHINQDITSIDLKTNQTFLFLSSNQGELRTELDRIKKNSLYLYRKLVTDDEIKKINELEEIIQKAIKEQEDNNIKKIIDAEVLPETKLKFFDSIFKEIDKNKQNFLELSKRFKKYDNRITLNEEFNTKNCFGYNQIVPKEAFIQDWHVHYTGFTESFSEGVLNSETAMYFKKLKENCTKVKNEDFFRQIVAEEIIIITNIWGWWRYNNNKYFIPNITDDPLISNFKIKTENGDKEIYNVISNWDEVHYLFAIRKQDLPTYIQYNPSPKEYNGLLHGRFYMNLEFMSDNQELLNDFISRNPKWLKVYPDKEKALKQKAVFQLKECFEFSYPNNFKGIYTVIKHPKRF